MPDLLPQIGPQPAPPPNKPAPSSASDNPVARGDDTNRDGESESFADAYDATESEDAPETAQGGETTATAEPSDIPPLPAAVVPPTPVIFVTNETDAPRATPKLATPIVAATETGAAGIPTAKPILPEGEADLPGPVRGEGRVQIAPGAPEAEVDLPRTGQRVIAPAPVVEPTGRAQPVQPPALAQDIEGAKTPTIETKLEPEILPDPDPERPLPERVGPRPAETQVAQTTGHVLSAMPQPPTQAASGVETSAAPLDEVLPTGPQGTGISPIVSPTAPGATPTQIVQHAAGQIVTALPRDQGVFITDTGAEIALDPPELGRVRMIVTEVAGGLALTITAERPETLDLFRRHASMLAGEFAREGFTDTNFAFEGETDRDGRQSDTEERPALRIAADPQDLINGINAQLTQGGGLDVRL